ncbi:MAG: hypothetical protein QM722_18510 [Piscinibacter sp.]
MTTGVPLANVIVPTEGRPVTVMVSALPSTSVGALRPSGVLADSSATVIVVLDATGASLTGVTVSDSELVELRLPSLTVTWIAGTGPLKLAAGVKVQLPSAFIVSVPTPPTIAVLPAAKVLPPNTKLLTVSAGPSTSLSLPSTLPVATLSSASVALSACATGASLTGCTVTTALTGDDTAPSLSVTVKPMLTLPLKFVAGTKTSPAACAGVSVAPAATGVTPSARNSVPLPGSWVTVTAATVPSASVPPRFTAIGVSSLPLPPEPMEATGASLTETMVSDTAAGAEVAPPLSVTVKRMVWSPWKSAPGRYSSVAACAGVRVWPTATWVTPSARNSVPPAGRRVTVTPTTEPSTSVPPSDSGSVPSSLPLAEAGVATGASLTGLSVIVVPPVTVWPSTVSV